MFGVAFVTWFMKSSIPFRVIYGGTAYGLLSHIQKKNRRNFNEKIVVVRKISL
jgi:hypothetical protein